MLDTDATVQTARTVVIDHTAHTLDIVRTVHTLGMSAVDISQILNCSAADVLSTKYGTKHILVMSLEDLLGV